MLIDDWEHYHHQLHLEEARDILAPPIPGAATRSFICMESGFFRLSRRTCSFYSILIEGIGSWGRVILLDGKGRELFHQPSTFTGSFVLDGCAEDGLYFHNYAGPGPDAMVTINWREPDERLV